VRSNYLASRGWLDFTRKDNGLNQYSGWWNYSVTNYDADLAGWGEPGHANGVLMQDGWITGSYNALNQPVSMWSSAFAGTSNSMWFGHDPLGRCVKRWIAPSAGTSGYNPATYFYYDGWSLIQEGGSATNATRLYVHGARVDEMVAQTTPGNSWRYFQYDARGHCILQTDASGDIAEQYDYDAFGFPYFYNSSGTDIHSSSWGNRFLFTGREWISELRTYDFRNRMYQPELGRFLQPDPKQFDAGDYNLYRYCHNDPVNKSDPTGLVDSNQAGGDSKGASEWEKSYNPSDRFTVVIHSDGKGFIVKGEYVSASKVADKMKADGYTAGKPVQLISCESGRDGKDSPAQKLANVLANNNKVETKVSGPDAKCESGTKRGADPTVQTNTKTGQPGEYKTFIGKPPDAQRDKKTDK
jgi:RHS repeat-associated protein